MQPDLISRKAALEAIRAVYRAGHARRIDSTLAAIERLPAVESELVEALEPFVRHGRAIGALSGSDGPFWIMTDEGHRDVPAEDFRRVVNALTRARGEQS